MGGSTGSTGVTSLARDPSPGRMTSRPLATAALAMAVDPALVIHVHRLPALY